MSSSSLGGLLAAYASACRNCDLRNASTRSNVLRVLLPMLRKHRAELLRDINADSRSINRSYLAQVMAQIREAREVIVDTLRRIRCHEISCAV
jgi:hypothetical protein